MPVGCMCRVAPFKALFSFSNCQTCMQMAWLNNCQVKEVYKGNNQRYRMKFLSKYFFYTWMIVSLFLRQSLFHFEQFSQLSNISTAISSFFFLPCNDIWEMKKKNTTHKHKNCLLWCYTVSVLPREILYSNNSEILSFSRAKTRLPAEYCWYKYSFNHCSLC